MFCITTLQKESNYGYDIEDNDYPLEELHEEIRENINSSQEYKDAIQSLMAEMKKKCPMKVKRNGIHVP